MALIDRPWPRDFDAERAVVVALALGWCPHALLLKTKQSDFLSDSYRRMYRTLAKLYSRELWPSSRQTAAALLTSGVRPIDIARLIDEPICSARGVKPYLDRLIECSKRRHAIQQAEMAVVQAHRVSDDWAWSQVPPLPYVLEEARARRS